MSNLFVAAILPHYFCAIYFFFMLSIYAFEHHNHIFLQPTFAGVAFYMGNL